ncbi:hypothetical protein ACTFIZ_012401 [Dictyostelium cf. discoideum]
MDSKYVLSTEKESKTKPSERINVSDMDSITNSLSKTSLGTRKVPTSLKTDSSKSGSSSGGSKSYISDESALRMVYGSTPRDDKTVTKDSITLAKEKKIEKRNEEIKLTFKAIRASECVDLLFIVDCTGSMGSYIEQIKSDIVKLQEALKLKHSFLDIEFGFIRYTDFDVKSNRCSTFQFSFVSEIRAQGGGDGPEDVFGGMDLINSMKWRPNSTRVVIHIADAPCHGTEYHSWPDSYPGGDPNGIKLDHLLTHIISLNINYYFGHINLEATELKNYQKIINSFDSKETSKMNERIFISIEESISVSKLVLTEQYLGHDIDRSTGKPRSEREFKIDTNMDIDFGTLPYIQMLQTKFKMPSDIVTCLSSSYEMKLNEITISIKIAPNPFSQGACRLAYLGIDEHGKKVVLKQSKFIGGRENSKKRYFESMECQTIAAKFALEFNKQLSLTSSEHQITFTVAKVLQMKHSEKPMYFGIETFINGEYQKYNSNCGWLKDDAMSEILQTFFHWTYQESKNKAIVVDIQGVKTSKGYLLTDPAIHSTDILRFGGCNLGKPGIIKFFQSHKCNQHCKKIGLTIPSFTSSSSTSSILLSSIPSSITSSVSYS